MALGSTQPITEMSKKAKQSHYRPEQAQRVGRGITLLFRDLGARNEYQEYFLGRGVKAAGA
jgi:hypothetical protein